MQCLGAGPQRGSSGGDIVDNEDGFAMQSDVTTWGKGSSHVLQAMFSVESGLGKGGPDTLQQVGAEGNVQGAGDVLSQELTLVESPLREFFGVQRYRCQSVDGDGVGLDIGDEGLGQDGRQGLNAAIFQATDALGDGAIIKVDAANAANGGWGILTTVMAEAAFGQRIAATDADVRTDGLRFCQTGFA